MADLAFEACDLGAAATGFAADVSFAQIFPDESGQHPQGKGHENHQEERQIDRPLPAQILSQIRRKGGQGYQATVGKRHGNQDDGQKHQKQESNEAHG